MKTIKLPLSDMPNLTLANEAEISYEMLDENPKFISLAPQITAFGGKATNFKAKLEAYETHKAQFAQLHSEMEAARAELETSYRGLASACEGITLNPADLESGGWKLRKTPAPVGPLPAPSNLRAKLGAFPGSTVLKCNPVHGAVSYVAECATSPAGPFTVVYQGTRPYCTATGMNPGGLYYFRMMALGAAGPSPYSDITEKRAA